MHLAGQAQCRRSRLNSNVRPQTGCRGWVPAPSFGLQIKKLSLISN